MFYLAWYISYSSLIQRHTSRHLLRYGVWGTGASCRLALRNLQDIKLNSMEDAQKNIPYNVWVAPSLRVPNFSSSCPSAASSWVKVGVVSSFDINVHIPMTAILLHPLWTHWKADCDCGRTLECVLALYLVQLPITTSRVPVLRKAPSMKLVLIQTKFITSCSFPVETCMRLRSRIRTFVSTYKCGGIVAVSLSPHLELSFACSCIWTADYCQSSIDILQPHIGRTRRSDGLHDPQNKLAC